MALFSTYTIMLVKKMLHLSKFVITLVILGGCDVSVKHNTVVSRHHTYKMPTNQTSMSELFPLLKQHTRWRRQPLCYQELSNNAGYFTSLNHYMDSPDCYTLIITNPTNVIILNFQTPETSLCQDCQNNFVEIYDGPSTEHRLLDRFTTPTKTLIRSTGNSLLMRFHCAERSEEQQEYKVQYVTESRTKRQITDGTTSCRWLKGERDGIITTPHYPNKYPPNQWCQIKLYAPEQYNFVIVMEDLNLEYDPKCQNDYLELIGGIDNDLAPRKRYCGSYSEKSLGSTIFPSNEVTVYFRSNTQNEYNGFRLSYYITKKTDNDHQYEFSPTIINQLHKDTAPSNSNSHLQPPDTVKPEDNVAHYTPSLSKSLQVEDIFLAYPKNATVIEKESHDLHCVPKDPSVSWKWYKDNELLNGTTPLPGLKLNKDLLTIEYMLPSLKGVYTCEITWNNQLVAVQAWISISRNKDCFLFSRKPKNMTAKEEAYITLECTTTSKSVKISWEKNGFSISRNARFQILANGNILVITDLQREDAGTYTCVAHDQQTGCEKREQATLKVTSKHDNCGQPTVPHAYTSLNKPFIAGGKIIGGQTSVKGAYPWQAMIWDQINNLAICGGSLITEKWVISAAHCLLESETHYTQWLILLGKNDIEIIEPEQENRKVQKALVYPSYNGQTHDKDICLLELSAEVAFTDYIQPICLEEPNFIEEQIFQKEFQLGTVTGWGRLVERGPQARLLQELQLPIVPQNICRQSTILTVTKNMFCAGYAEEIAGVGRDACEGDSGGPFAVLYQNRWYLVGIVSWSEGYGECARPNKYGFYTKVSNFYHWIKEKTGIL